MKSYLLISLVAIVAALSTPLRAALPPIVGERAPSFSLNTLDGKSIELQQILKHQPVLLVVLRGWPGYQCPLCTKQVREFAAKAADFTAHGAQVLMVYPGPAGALRAHAQEFLQDKEWPKEFLFVIDPDYAFTNLYGLRWDAKNETAFPSTFVIGRSGTIHFANVSRRHGGRVSAEAALEALRAVK